MAICTHEFALRDLFEHAPLVPMPPEIAEIALLFRARKVVPLHRHRREDPSAVGARRALFEAQVPGNEPGLTLLLVLEEADLVLLVVLGVIFARAVLTPGLVPPLLRAVEVGDRLSLAASAAMFVTPQS
jgi:hypothetical protein